MPDSGTFAVGESFAQQAFDCGALCYPPCGTASGGRVGERGGVDAHAVVVE